MEGVSRFCVKNISLTMPQHFEEESFLQYSTKTGYRKMLGQKGGGNHNFSKEWFLLTVTNIFVQDYFSVSLNSGIKNF